MNILLLNWRDVHHPKSGGAEKVTLEHAKRWVEKGNTVTWLTAQYTGCLQDETIDGVHILRRAGSITVYLYSFLYVLFFSPRFDVVVDEVHGLPFFSVLFTKKPVIVYIHEIAGEIWDFMFRFPVNVFGKHLEKLYFYLYRHCLFWTVAPSTIDELVDRGIPRNQCTAIPNPLVLAKSFSSKLHAKEKHPTYIFISRVVRMKGIEEVIKSFSFIVQAEPDSKLWIVGRGEDHYVQELKNMIAEYGGENHVKFWGSVSEEKKFELLSKSHVLLHASVKEGWGLVVLEAAYAGTPSVVYNVAGLKDVVLHRKTGTVIQSNSPSEMAKEAISLVHDRVRYLRYQQNARTWSLQYNWDTVSDASLKILKQACTRKMKHGSN